MMPEDNPSTTESLSEIRRGLSEDVLAIGCAIAVLLISFAAVYFNRPMDLVGKLDAAAVATDGTDAVVVSNPLKPYVAKPGKWSESVTQSLWGNGSKSAPVIGVLVVFLSTSLLIAGSLWIQGKSPRNFLLAFPIVFALATAAYVISAHVFVKSYNLEYALWALAAGLLVSHTVGTPAYVKPAVMTEFYIKTGLVLLGAEVLMSRLLALGVPGIFVAWVVTPIVLVSTFWFGQKVLKIASPSLNMVISADMSVCGVSAAIATAAACRAKKEELSLAVGMSLSFTVVMMVVMPAIIKAVGMGEVLGGAWLGGTIDSTGAVAVAGAVLGEKALTVAATVKMIQNILIGVTAFFVAVYWVSRVDTNDDGPRVGLSEIWIRFPKFVLGFVAMSVLFSILYSTLVGGPEMVDAMISGSTKTFRGWFFCLAFVSIGLGTNVKELLPQLKGGKPLILYACGQSLNLCLTLFMAWLMFKVIFVDYVIQ